MSFTGSIEIVQTAKNIITVNDNSTGSDPNITDRHLTFTRSDGSKKVPAGTTTDYVDFPIGSSSITLNLLDRDYAMTVFAEWFSSSPLTGSTYTFTAPFIFTWYTRLFLYGLSQEKQVALPNLVQNGNFFANKSKMWAEILSANSAVQFGLDVVNAQQELNSAYKMMIRPQLYF